MNKDDLVKYGLMAVGGYLVYTWLANNGYLSQFGIGTPATVPAAALPPGTVSMVTPPTQNAYPSVFVQPAQLSAPANTTPAASTGSPAIPVVTAPINVTLQNAIASASQGDPGIVNGMASVDLWNYYRNALTTPLTPDQFNQVFPELTAANRGSMTLSAFLGRINSALGFSGVGGMGSVVKVANVPQIPSMSFSGTGRPAFGRRGGWGN